MKFICPLITVTNIQNSRLFYEQLLRQKVKLDMGENIFFEGGFALHLKSHFSDLIHPHTIKYGGNNFELYFEEDQLEDLFQKLKDQEIELVHELKEQPWRQRVIRFYDPDKNIVEVGETMEHVAYRLYLEGNSISEIEKITYLATKVIEESILKYQTN